MSNSNRKRITMKLKTPNPLFEKWLTEWKNNAKAENSKMEYCFDKALRSLKKYPLPMENGRDCKILKGFGDKLCQMLDKRLKEHQMEMANNLNATGIGNMQETEPLKKKRRSNSEEYLPKERSGGYAILITLYTQSLDPKYPGYMRKQEIIEEGQHLSHTSFTKPDPGSRYTAWSSMRTLLEKNLVIKRDHPPKFSLSDEGLALARKLFDKGKTTDSNTCQPLKEANRPIRNVQEDIICLDLSDDEIPSSNFTSLPVEQKGFPSKQIVRHASTSTITSSAISDTPSDNAVYKTKTFEKQTSSSSGISSTQTSVESSEIRLSNKSKTKTIQRFTSVSSVASSVQSSSQEESFILPPNSFDIILYVDTCETSGSHAMIQDDPILADLQRLQVAYEVKDLKIGDYLWICRDRTSDRELVLPYIVERKRMDDFAQSIKDGRYHEQKFRLKKSGIQNVTYLIEKYGHSQYVGLPLSTLHQAATNTAIQDGFCVKFTENIRDTARYLANFSSVVVKMFQSKTLVSCPKENLSDIFIEDDLISIMTFKEFNRASVKNKPMKVSDLFVKMLLQINGMSVDRALAIVELYPTPALLTKAYDENPGVAGEKLLAPIQFGDSKKSIGPTLSKIIHQLFTLKSFN